MTMKTCVAVLAGLALALMAQGQGMVNFNNRVVAAGIDAPVTWFGVGLDGADGWVAQLQVGTFEWSSLTPVGEAVRFRSGVGAGYFNGGIVTVEGHPPVSDVFMAVAVWNLAEGPSYQAVRDAGGIWGMSNVIRVRLDIPLIPPSDLIGLQPLALVPEPSTWSLGLSGLALLLLRRRC